ncbi:MAG TPA: GNAT family N-acetyltransferase [candidate division Zixibacteria bacterium]|nr:GNAT family N-acetyltransferase [candidate division Zixibacteria bacterium]
MTDNNWGRITTYSPSMAKKAAKMFNEFNELWPGSFSGGVPYTEERVHDWLDKTSAIADLIAIDDDEDLVGYCGLYPHWRDKKAAYISILGVTPKVKGKKFGKRLLLKSLEIAEEKGITRVDLHTWGGNLDAVPLYKKIGLFWVPDTSVYMQDFIPGILQSNIAKDWFKKHPNWYGNFKRELIQAPDNNIVDNMELYTYKFEEGEDSLNVEIDRFGWGICGFEKMLEGKSVSIKTRVKSHEIYIGIPNELTITIMSNIEDTAVDLEINEFPGLNWKETFPKTIDLKKGEAFSITREFVVNKTSKTFRDNDRKNEGIITNITIGENTYKLITSGKIQSAVQLRGVTENRFKTLPFDKESRISFDLINNTNVELKGEINFSIEGLDSFNQKIAFNISPKEISGIEIPITLPLNAKKNQFMINAHTTINVDKKFEEMPIYQYPVLIKSNKLFELIEIKDREILHLVTDKLNVRVNLEGGQLRIIQRENSGGAPLNHASGPPYGLSLDRTLLFEHEIKYNGKDAILILSGKSIQVPGLLVKKFIRVSLGTNEVEYWVEYTNTNKEESLHVSARTTTASGGISINPYTAKGRAYTPIGGKIIESDALTNFVSDPLVPSKPDFWHETWTAAEGLMNNDYIAWIWKPDNIEKIKASGGQLAQLESKTIELQPKEKTKPVHLWFCFGMNSLEDVRNRWNQLVGNQIFDPEEEFVGLKITQALDIKLIGDNVLQAGEKIKKSLEIFFVSAYPLPSTLTMKIPRDWKGGFITKDGIKNEIPIPQLTSFEATSIEIEIEVPEKTKSTIEKISILLSGEFDFNFDFYFLIATQDTIEFNEKGKDRDKVKTVSNGYLSFEVPEKIGGNLIRLKDDKNKDFLLDQYPEIGPKFFFDSYLGGLQPILFHTNADNPFYEQEKSETSFVEEGFWKGVKSTWTITHDKEYLAGQKVEVKYLILPGSNIIRMVLTQKNPTAREIRSIVGIMADVALQGSKDQNIIEAQGATKTWIRNPFQKPFITQGSFIKPQCRVTKGKQSIAFVVPKGFNATAIIGDFGVMLFSWLLGFSFVKPFDQSRIEFAIILNDDQEKMIQLREALARKE